MNVKITGVKTQGVINAIPSKSYAHRIAICKYLAGQTPRVDCGQFTSKDIEVTVNCLENLLEGVRTLDCGESGSTLRFLLPLCASLGGEYTFIGHGKLMERPLEQLFIALEDNGVTVEKSDVIKINGKLKAGEYKIRGDISSQYVSGLLMALPTLESDSKITLTTPLVSAPYVEITLQVLNEFGVKIERTSDGFIIKGNQHYNGDLVPEGDWSNGAFFLVLGALNGDITVKGLNLNSAQGDKYIIDILRLANAQVIVLDDGVRVVKSHLTAFTFDAEDCPDLVPIASVLGAFAKGETVIKNIERLKLKESDRVQSTIAMLTSFGVTATTDGNNLTVYGKQATAGVVDGFNDHRIVMSATVLASAINGQTVIEGAQAINKSYPNFFEHFNLLGGNACEV